MNPTIIKFKPQPTFWAKTADKFVLVNFEDPKEEHKQYLNQFSYSNLKEYISIVVLTDNEENAYEFNNEDFGNCLYLVKEHLNNKNFIKINLKINYWTKVSNVENLIYELNSDQNWLQELIDVNIPNKISEINNLNKVKK